MKPDPMDVPTQFDASDYLLHGDGLPQGHRTEIPAIDISVEDQESKFRAAVERLRNVSEPREFDLFNGAFDRRNGWNDAIDAVLDLWAGDKAEAPR